MKLKRILSSKSKLLLRGSFCTHLTKLLKVIESRCEIRNKIQLLLLLLCVAITTTSNLCWRVEELRVCSVQQLNFVFLGILGIHVLYISLLARNFSFSATLSLTVRILLVCPRVPDQCLEIPNLSLLLFKGFKLSFGVWRIYSERFWVVLLVQFFSASGKCFFYNALKLYSLPFKITFFTI